MGIFAEWGTGKTTLMNSIDKVLLKIMMWSSFDLKQSAMNKKTNLPWFSKIPLIFYRTIKILTLFHSTINLNQKC